MPGRRRHFCAVVVSYYTGPVLDACLDALIASPLCSQIVLINNGNPPNVVTALHARTVREPKLTLMHGHGNIGFGRGCNLGATQARDDLLVFVNPDCVIEPETLSVFEDALTHFPDALIGGALRNADGSEQRGCRRGELTLWSALISFVGLGRPGEAAGIWRDFNRMEEPMPSATSAMPVVSGGLMAMRAGTFASVGGFDPAFFLHVEDIDLCRRVREGGGRVMLAPKAIALHIGATSATSTWSIERAKINSFRHYFWKNARTFWGYVGVIVVMPILSLAVVMRMILRSKA